MKYQFLHILFWILFSSSLSAQVSNSEKYDYDFIQNERETEVENFLSPLIKCEIDNRVSESSGLVWTDGALWSHNDSNNPASIYKIDTASGKVLQQVNIQNYTNTDWEDIASDSAFIYIGDFGNNNGTRKDLKILKINKSQIGTQPIVTLSAISINFSYPDQTEFTSNSNTNFNCEALISFNNFLYIFTKNHGDFMTKLYKLPKIEGTYVAEKIGLFDAKGLITGADISKNGKELLLLGYVNSHSNSFIWRLTDFNSDDFFSGIKQKIIIGNNNDWQTEGISFSDSLHVWISNEVSGIKQSLFGFTESDILKDIAGRINRFTDFKIKGYPNPCNGNFTLNLNDFGTSSLKIYNLKGEKVYRENGLNGIQEIKTELPSGIYFIDISNERNSMKCKLIIY